MPTKSGSYETSGIKVSVYQVIEIRTNNFSFFSLNTSLSERAKLTLSRVPLRFQIYIYIIYVGMYAYFKNFARASNYVS